MSYLRKIGRKFYIEFYWQGKRYTRSLKVSERRSAIKLQNEIDYEISRGTFNPELLHRKKNIDTPLSQFIDRYSKHLHLYRKKYSDRTTETYNYTGKILKGILGEVYLSEIDSDLVETRIMPYLWDNYSYATVRHHLSNLRTMFNKAIEWNLISSNPFNKKVPKKERKQPRYFQSNEIEMLREYFSQSPIPEWQGEMVFLVLNTGLRKSEILNLDWKNIDLINEQIIFPGKGNKERVVPLNEKALEILRKKSKTRHISDSRVFYNIKNKTAIDSMWRKVRKRTGISGRFHDLRKTYACYYAMHGGSIERLREILGHEDYATVRIYETLSPDSLQKDKNIVGF